MDIGCILVYELNCIAYADDHKQNRFDAQADATPFNGRSTYRFRQGSRLAESQAPRLSVGPLKHLIGFVIFDKALRLWIPLNFAS